MAGPTANDCNGAQLVLFANSSDGLSWEKPELGLFDMGTVRPDLKSSYFILICDCCGIVVGLLWDWHVRD